MTKSGKCSGCGATRIVKRDLCKRCRAFDKKVAVEEEEESE